MKKTRLRAIVGFKLSGHEQLPIVAVHSDLGIEYQPKSSHFSFGFRNFFNTQQASKRPYPMVSDKGLLFMTSSNTFDLFYTIPLAKKNNILKLGFGVYFARYQNASDQLILIWEKSHRQGIEMSIYRNLKWINIGFRQQVQLFYNYQHIDIGTKEIYRFNLCFEIPIRIK